MVSQRRSPPISFFLFLALITVLSKLIYMLACLCFHWFLPLYQNFTKPGYVLFVLTFPAASSNACSVLGECCSAGVC